MPRTREGAYTVCVYGSSSAKTPDEYKRVSRKLGNLLADGGHMTVNGAGKAGCMGALNDGVTERCGRVRGVIHEMWIVDKSEHPKVHDLKVVGGHGLQLGGHLTDLFSRGLHDLPGWTCFAVMAMVPRTSLT